MESWLNDRIKHNIKAIILSLTLMGVVSVPLVTLASDSNDSTNNAIEIEINGSRTLDVRTASSNNSISRVGDFQWVGAPAGTYVEFSINGSAASTAASGNFGMPEGPRCYIRKAKNSYCYIRLTVSAGTCVWMDRYVSDDEARTKTFEFKPVSAHGYVYMNNATKLRNLVDIGYVSSLSGSWTYTLTHVCP